MGDANLIFASEWTDAHDEPCLASLGFLYMFLAAFVFVAIHDTLWVVMTPWRWALRWIDRVRWIHER